MTSHREAPKISKDPVADNTDLYAFVSPDKTDKVTILANYIPLEEPAGGPNFNSFGDDVLYEIMIDNDSDGIEDITYQFRFNTTLETPNSFLYNTGQIGSLSDKNWNMKQFYSVTKVTGPRRSGSATLLNSSPLPTPPVNIGPRSTPNYKGLSDSAVNMLNDGSRVFAGQRNEAFFVDLGSIFDLAALRPLQNLHLIPTPASSGVDATKGYNVHTIALQVSKTLLTSDGSPATDATKQTSVIGIWASASRRQATILAGEEEDSENESSSAVQTGPFTQVSRLGMPLINEVVIPLGKKDLWNTTHPRFDSQFLVYYQTPELQKLLPVLYPGQPGLPIFPHLAAYNKPRADLVAILLTGIPSGIIGGFQNFTGPVQADYLRLNMGIPPAASPSSLGLLGGDVAGFPNGRRIADDVVNIELRAIAGVTLPLVDPSFVPDGAAGALDQGIAGNPTQFIDFPVNVVTTATLQSFPYLPYPAQGYEHSHD